MESGDIVILKRKDGSSKFLSGYAPLFYFLDASGEFAYLIRYREEKRGLWAGEVKGRILKVPLARVGVVAKDETMRYYWQKSHNPYNAGNRELWIENNFCRGVIFENGEKIEWAPTNL
jgi:hypothetical protein